MPASASPFAIPSIPSSMIFRSLMIPIPGGLRVRMAAPLGLARPPLLPLLALAASGVAVLAISRCAVDAREHPSNRTQYRDIAPRSLAARRGPALRARRARRQGIGRHTGCETVGDAPRDRGASDRWSRIHAYLGQRAGTAQRFTCASEAWMVRTDVQPASWWLAGPPRSSSSQPRLETSKRSPHRGVREDERWTFERSWVAS